MIKGGATLVSDPKVWNLFEEDFKKLEIEERLRKHQQVDNSIKPLYKKLVFNILFNTDRQKAAIGASVLIGCMKRWMDPAAAWGCAREVGETMEWQQLLVGGNCDEQEAQE